MTDETGPEEKSAEVAGPLAALKKAAEAFRSYELSHREKSLEVSAQIKGVSMQGSAAEIVAVTQDATDRMKKSVANGALAEMCERAAADLEEMLERAGQVRERTREVASPSALFRAGHGYGFQRGLWNGLTEEDQEKAGEAPPPTWEAAWALVRAQLATGGKI